MRRATEVPRWSTRRTSSATRPSRFSPEQVHRLLQPRHPRAEAGCGRPHEPPVRGRRLNRPSKVRPSVWLSIARTPLPPNRSEGQSRAQNDGGDDGTRTRVNGFADRSLATRARRHAHLALAAPRGFEPRFTDPKSAVLPVRRRGIGAPEARLAGHPRKGEKMERKTGLEPATLTLAR